jgi:hypothetical protein
MPASNKRTQLATYLHGEWVAGAFLGLVGGAAALSEEYASGS